MDHRWARKPVLVNRWAGATRTEEKQREGAPWRRAAGTFRKTRIYSLPTGASLGSYRRRSLRLKRPQNGTRQKEKPSWAARRKETG